MIFNLFRKTSHFDTKEPIYLELFEKSNSDIYKVTIDEVIPQKILRISAPEKGFRIVPISRGEYVRGFFFRNQKMHEFYVPVLERVGGRNPVVTLKYPSKIDTINRRRHERVHCNIPVSIRLLPLPHSNWLDQYGHVLDISAGGAKIKAHYRFSKNQCLELNVQFSSNKTRRVLAHVIDAKPQPDHNIIHIAFVSLPDHERMQFYTLIKNPS